MTAEDAACSEKVEIIITSQIHFIFQNGRPGTALACFLSRQRADETQRALILEATVGFLSESPPFLAFLQLPEHKFIFFVARKCAATKQEAIRFVLE